MTSPTPEKRVLAADGGVFVQRYVCRATPRDPAWVGVRDELTLSLVRRGSFVYTREGATRIVGPGCVLVGRPGDEVCLAHDHRSGDDGLVFGYTAEALDEVARAEGHAGVPPQFFAAAVLPPTARVASLACLTELRLAHPADSADWSVLARDLAAAVLRAEADARGARGDGHVSPAMRRRVRAAIRQLEVGEATVEALAEAAGLSAFHFIRVFRQETGSTPHRYVVRRRLQRAVDLLLGTDRPVTEIALEVGFGDFANFLRTFRRDVGMTPTALRRRAGRPTSRPRFNA